MPTTYHDRTDRYSCYGRAPQPSTWRPGERTIQPVSYTHLLNKYTDQWPSIESTFIADARFLAAHFPHPRWQPLWYTGTRFDYIYPPALRYGTAILSKITGWWPVKAYHFYTIFFYCLGVVGVYFLARVAGRARGFAILAGAATALVSPCFLFMKDLRVDSSFLTPLRLEHPGVGAKPRHEQEDCLLYTSRCV